MTHTPAPHAKAHYFVPATSNYSTFLSAGIFLLEPPDPGRCKVMDNYITARRT